MKDYLEGRKPNEFTVYRIEGVDQRSHAVHTCSSFEDLRKYLRVLNDDRGSADVRFVAKDGLGEDAVVIYAEEVTV